MSKPLRLAAVGISCLLINFFGVTILFSIAKTAGGIQRVATSAAESNVAPIPQSPPKLNIKITNKAYSSGYLQLDGIVTNSGKEPVFSPLIEIKIFKDAKHTTWLTEATVAPNGTELANLNPSAKVAFETIIYVPGEPDEVYPDFAVK